MQIDCNINHNRGRKRHHQHRLSSGIMNFNADLRRSSSASGLNLKCPEAFAPEYENELALHPKKLEELKKWFRSRLGANNKFSRLFLITGPTGSGKKTAVRVICGELGIEVVEYDPVEDQRLELDAQGEELVAAKGSAQFIRFMLDTEFSSIQRMSLKHRLLLIGQIPHSYISEPKKLHQLLAVVMTRTRNIIAIVLPNVDSCWQLSPYRLFSPDMIVLLDITHIKFNSISNTLMTAALKRAYQMMRQRFNAEQARNVVNMANGDIRRALNHLLYLQAGRSAVGRRSSSSNSLLANKGGGDQNQGKKSRLQSSTSGMITLRRHETKTTANEGGHSMPDHLELFHFIGKVLYAKRADPKRLSMADLRPWKVTEKKLHPKAIAKFGRPLPPKDNLNQLIGSAPISANMLTEYIYDNEPKFGPSISAIARIYGILAGMDVLMNSNFEHAPLLEKYAMEIAVRASLFHNYRTSGSAALPGRFYQFERPKFREVLESKRIESRCHVADYSVATTIRIGEQLSLSSEEFQIEQDEGETAAAEEANIDDGFNYDIDESED